MRLFIAIDFSDDVKKLLQEYQPVEDEQNTLAKPSQLHLTLHFIGNADVSIVHDSISNIQFEKFRIYLDGIGCFGGIGRSKIIWAGVRKSKELMNLHSSTGTLLQHTGIKLDSRDYSPHITLARWKQGSSEEKIKSALGVRTKVVEYCVDYFSLYSSEIVDGVSQYREIHKYHSGVAIN